MAKLVYIAIASLDGYVADENGDFGWSAPDEEVHSFVNDLARPLGTQLLGRRMYEVLVYWETEPAADASAPEHDYARIWRSADKVVYSRTLETPASARTTIEREFDPAAVAEMKAGAQRDLGIGGPELAAQAFRSGLIDECHLILVPAIVGGGKRALPDGVRLDLDLVDTHRFGNGAVHLHYRIR